MTLLAYPNRGQSVSQSVSPESADKSFDGSYTQNPLPFYLAGDDAFPLENNIMKPYSQRNLSDEKKDLQLQAFQSTTDQ